MDRYALGHTLVELLVVLGLVAIVATFAVPAFAELRANAARDERVSRLVRTLQLARVEALAHGRPVVVCDRRGAPAARAVVVSRTGRVRVSARDADGGPLACP